MSMVLGFVWYGPLFGKPYMRMQGVTEADVEKFKTDPKKKSQMMRNYAFTFVLALITAYLLSYFLVFGSIVLGLTGVLAGVKIAFMAWLAFVVPATANLVFFDKKKWDWWFLVNGYYLVQLVAMGSILAVWM